MITTNLLNNIISTINNIASYALYINANSKTYNVNVLATKEIIVINKIEVESSDVGMVRKYDTEQFEYFVNVENDEQLEINEKTFKSLVKIEKGLFNKTMAIMSNKVIKQNFDELIQNYYELSNKIELEYKKDIITVIDTILKLNIFSDKDFSVDLSENAFTVRDNKNKAFKVNDVETFFFLFNDLSKEKEKSFIQEYEYFKEENAGDTNLEIMCKAVNSTLHLWISQLKKIKNLISSLE